jgi:hypothetical protein
MSTYEIIIGIATLATCAFCFVSGWYMHGAFEFLKQMKLEDELDKQQEE